MFHFGKWVLIATFAAAGLRGFQDDDVSPQDVERPSIDQRLSDTISIVRSDDVGAPTDLQYVVECDLVANPQPGDTKAAARKPMTIRIPRFIVSDGEQVTIRDVAVKQQLVSTRAENGREMPIIRLLDEGTTVEATVISLGQDEVAIDIDLDLKSARQVPANKAPSVRVDSVKGRAIEWIKLGKPAKIQLRDFTVEVTVNAAAAEAK